MIKSRNKLRLHRKRRIRAKVFGTTKRPRMSVFRSLKRMEVQVIDDLKGNTLVFGDTKSAKAKNNIEGARILGKLIAKKCLEIKIKEAVFDRSGYKYHGKVKALAEGAREVGIKF
ncbi:MAG TPA: 50S ribosomal protein L18 [Candidatus Moranbacteria bacterium]|nr:50S ribosomal protein L18 [Candidatus Moranbacteria bacterium]